MIAVSVVCVAAMTFAGQQPLTVHRQRPRSAALRQSNWMDRERSPLVAASFMFACAPIRRSRQGCRCTLAARRLARHRSFYIPCSLIQFPARGKSIPCSFAREFAGNDWIYRQFCSAPAGKAASPIEFPADFPVTSFFRRRILGLRGFLDLAERYFDNRRSAG